MDSEKAAKIVGEVKADGGGDYPEAVMAGLRVGLTKTSWREKDNQPSLRIIYHCTDAPPHGKQFTSDDDNKEWAENGSPDGTTEAHIARLLKTKHVKYNLLIAEKSNENRLKDMKDIFSKEFGRYYKTAEVIKYNGKEPAQRYRSHGLRAMSDDDSSDDEMEEELEYGLERSKGVFKSIAPRFDESKVPNYEINEDFGMCEQICDNLYDRCLSQDASFEDYQ